MFYIKEANCSEIERDLNIFLNILNDQERSQIEAVYYRIARKLFEYFSLKEEKPYQKELSCFLKGSENKEIIGFVNVVWYLAKLGIPPFLIGKQNIKKASLFYKRVGNQMKYKYLASLN